MGLAVRAVHGDWTVTEGRRVHVLDLCNHLHRSLRRGIVCRGWGGRVGLSPFFWKPGVHLVVRRRGESSSSSRRGSHGGVIAWGSRWHRLLISSLLHWGGAHLAKICTFGSKGTGD